MQPVRDPLVCSSGTPSGETSRSSSRTCWCTRASATCASTADRKVHHLIFTFHHGPLMEVSWMLHLMYCREEIIKFDNLASRDIKILSVEVRAKILSAHMNEIIFFRRVIILDEILPHLEFSRKRSRNRSKASS